MRTITFLLIYTIAVVTLILSNTVSAQKNDVAFNSPPFRAGLVSPFQKMGFEKKAYNFNIKAVRDFVKKFKTVHNNRWLLEPNGNCTSIFTSDEITTRVTYSSDGSQLYILKIYNENKMDKDIRDIVKREYYDLTITLVKELETDEGLFIYVHLEDRENLKIVRIADGEMEVVGDFKKN